MWCLFQVNYNDGTVEGRDDATWQENLSDYNSDFSAPSGDLFCVVFDVIWQLLAL